MAFRQFIVTGRQTLAKNRATPCRGISTKRGAPGLRLKQVERRVAEPRARLPRKPAGGGRVRASWYTGNFNFKSRLV
jgi:hypothetical protein